MDKKFQVFSDLVVKIVKVIHKELGPGFRENVYQSAFSIELRKFDISYQKEMSFEIFYKKQFAGVGELDFFINDKKLPNVIIETKSVDKINDNHRSQLVSYLKSAKHNFDKDLSNTKYGILINWPGAYLDENKNFVFINKSPEIELFQVESNNVRSMIV
tara:strand:+ start:528 stop:1004 length:477 start_codon:yes stop_codon:yes gene_type:complete